MLTLLQPRGLVRLFARLVALTCLLAAPTLALDPVKAAENMARQAATAFESGDHARAAQLYLQAFASNSAIPDYIYGAARAEHAAGKFAVAERHYDEFLNVMPSGKRADNARKYLAEVRVAIAEQKVAEAEQAEREQNWGLAAQIYRTCAELAPANWEYAYRDGAALARAGKKSEAIARLEAYLRDAPADARDRGEAKARLEALQPGKEIRIEPAKPAVVKPAPVVKPVAAPQVVAATAPADPRGSERAVAWTVAGVGAAAALTGLGLAISASLDRTALDNKLALDAHTGLIEGITYPAAKAQSDAIDQKRLVAGVVGGVGVLAAGAGAWLVWRSYREPAKVTVLPTGDGFVAMLRF